MSIQFSHPIKEIISLSREEAVRLGNDSIDSGHLLLALVKEGKNAAYFLLSDLKLDLPSLQREIEQAVEEKTGSADHHALKTVPVKSWFNIKKLLTNTGTPLTRQAENVIRGTVSEAKISKSEAVEPVHLLLSMLANRDSIASKVLTQFGLDYDTVFRRIGNTLIS